jgi:DNA-binding transcriptional LysR family regulator
LFDARRLPTFREVARRGSFSAAAAALGYTPSAVSQQMAALEREVGAKLFERNHRGVRLTDPGARLLAHTDALLDLLAQAETDLATGAEPSGNRRVSIHQRPPRMVFQGWR